MQETPEICWHVSWRVYPWHAGALLYRHLREAVKGERIRQALALH